jgi:hypothetical protein
VIESEMPFQNTGLISSQLVSNPPENKIEFKATIPINCATDALSKWIPPIPSEPANIPTIRKKISAGTPKRYMFFPAITLISRSTESISKNIFSF